MPTNTSKRIFITGATGCVGQYMVDELLETTPHQLVLVVRNTAKLTDTMKSSPRVEVVEADVGDVDSYRDRLGNIDVAILIHACWGGPDAYRINVDTNLALIDHFVRAGAERVIYFGTASVLDAQGELLPAAHELGSEYIRSKYQLTEAVGKLTPPIDVVGLYPTLVLGGGNGKPMSHFANLLKEVRSWAWLVRFFRAEGRFHYIHAKDIARTTRHLVDAPRGSLAQTPRIVLGNPVITANAFIEQFSRFLGFRLPFSINLRDGFAELVIKIFRIQMSPWDRYCMQHRDLSFRHAVNPATFGMQVHCPDVATALSGIGLGAETVASTGGGQGTRPH